MTARARTALVVIALVVAIVGAIALRVVVEGRHALADGDDAIAARRPLDAIAAWERAARWYLPGAPHVDDAYARLIDLAGRDPAVDVIAWRAVRSAALASRSFYQPHAEELSRANAEIARITSKDPEGSITAGDTPAAREAWQRERLAHDTRPSTGATALAIVGIAAWLGGLGWIVRRRRLVPGLAIAVVGLAAWAAGLYNA